MITSLRTSTAAKHAKLKQLHLRFTRTPFSVCVGLVGPNSFRLVLVNWWRRGPKSGHVLVSVERWHIR